jgi:hypothetical protein
VSMCRCVDVSMCRCVDVSMCRCVNVQLAPATICLDPLTIGTFDRAPASVKAAEKKAEKEVPYPRLVF